MSSEKPQALASAYAVMRKSKKSKMAHGGEVMDDTGPAPQSIAEAIRRARADKKMDEMSSQVDLSENEEEQPNSFDELNVEATEEGPEPETEPDNDFRKRNLVSNIRKGMKARREE